MALHDSLFPLAQCMALRWVSLLGVVAKFSVTDACFGSEDTFDEVHDQVETPLEGSHDVFMYKEFHTLGSDSIVLPNLLDHSHVSPMHLQPSLSPEYYIDVPSENLMIFYANNDLGYGDNMFSMLGTNVNNFMSLSYFSGYNVSLDPYCMFLVNVPRKLMWNTFSDSLLIFLWCLVY